jgi:hypothetical protein
MSDSATYVYCIVERARRPVVSRAPAGVPHGGRPAVLALEPSIWAVVSHVPLGTYGPGRLDDRLLDLDWVSIVAVGHARVVEHFTRMREATVVPLKVFTMFSDDRRAVREMEAGRRMWSRALKRIRGCSEWGVRITAGVAAVPDRHAASASSGTAFLAAKKRARDESRARVHAAAQAAEDAFVRLSRVSRDARRHDAPPQATRPPLLDAAFLVPASGKARFDAAAASAATACKVAGADLALTGPWPAYNFVQGSGR